MKVVMKMMMRMVVGMSGDVAEVFSVVSFWRQNRIEIEAVLGEFWKNESNRWRRYLRVCDQVLGRFVEEGRALD